MTRSTIQMFPLPFAAVIAMALVACSSDPNDDTDAPSTDTNVSDNGGSETGGPTDDVGRTDTGGEPDLDDRFRDVPPDIGDGCNTLGCPCDADNECLSRYCLSFDNTGLKECSERCSDSCSLESYSCRLLENTEGDAVRLCVPISDPYCRECETVTDCGSLRAACVQLATQRVCIPGCTDSSLCPSGSFCQRFVGQGVDGQFCVPEADICEGCIDGDGDGYGVGPDCLGPDPVDDDPSVYPGAPEICDYKDNNLDGVIDGGIPESLRNACGGCFDLPAEPGSPCGPCGRDEWVCHESNIDDVTCNGETFTNACGGCGRLSHRPGDPCGTCGSGSWACDGSGGLVCDGDGGEAARNGCGGCGTLNPVPGDPCGACGSGTAICAGATTVQCSGDRGLDAYNACGGCLPLEGGDGLFGAPCGRCLEGRFACAEDRESWVCDDPGPRNACGGCEALPAPVGSQCGRCLRGTYQCSDINPDHVVCDDPDANPGPGDESCMLRGTLRNGWAVGTYFGASREATFNAVSTTSTLVASSTRVGSPFRTE